MKKTYIEPQMEAYMIETEIPLALSTGGEAEKDLDVLGNERFSSDEMVDDLLNLW